jgi:hypothetical protein
VAITLRGYVESKPLLVGKDHRHLALFLFQDKTYNEISCVSSKPVDQARKWKRGDKVALFGKWESKLISGQPKPLFMFKSAIRQPA